MIISKVEIDPLSDEISSWVSKKERILSSVWLDKPRQEWFSSHTFYLWFGFSFGESGLVG